MSDTTPSPDEIKRSIAPKSDQLNADDLIAGAITVTITKVRRGNREQPIWVDLEGYEGRPYKPCVSMLRVLVSVFTEEAREWVGQRMTLFRDPEVQFKGDTVGGIRISHTTNLKEPKTLSLTEKRGRRREWVVYPIETVTPQEQSYIDDAKGEIACAETPESLKAIGFILVNKSKAVQNALRPAYSQRHRELTEATE